MFDLKYMDNWILFSFSILHVRQKEDMLNFGEKLKSFNLFFKINYEVSK